MVRYQYSLLILPEVRGTVFKCGVNQMPTYEYQCKKCDYIFEKFQSIKDEPVKRCPKCKGAVKRLVGAGAGIIFKGSGFYETDYKRKSPGKPSEKASEKKESTSSSDKKE